MPSMQYTTLEIKPYPASKGNKSNILPLNPIPESKLKMRYKYNTTPHLTTLSDADRLEIERNFPPIYPYDSWARIKWGQYMLPTSPTSIHTTSLSHIYYSDPVKGKLPPIIYK